MSRLSKSSSVTGKRIHNSFVERSKQTRRAEAIPSVNPINSTKNQTAYSSGNYLITSDEFYEKLKKLKDEYKKFYHNEQILKQLIEHLRDNKGNLGEGMRLLVEQYNETMASLQYLDQAHSTNYLKNIEDILLNYREDLTEIGIEIVNDVEFNFDEDFFVRAIKDSRNPLNFLFEPVKGFVVELYRQLRRLKVPIEDREKAYKGIQSTMVYKGIIIDDNS